MPEEENKKLRDLVSETLQTKGVLGRIQAEIRASVFLALEEQDVFKDKSPFINKQLKEFLRTSDGITAISLVREFLEFFNLEFALMVFDPETQAGFDYNYEGRTKLATSLKISDNDKQLPLLSHILKLSKPSLNNQSDKDDLIVQDNLQTNAKVNETTNGTSNSIFHPFNAEDIAEEARQQISKAVQDKFTVQNTSNSDKTTLLDFTNKVEDRLHAKNTKENMSMASLTSLSNLPPIGRPNPQEPKDKREYDLKALLGLNSDRHYEDDFLSDSEQIKKGNKTDAGGSEESEIEEEISGISNLSAQQEDNTTDISVSKGSGHGDFLENL